MYIIYFILMYIMHKFLDGRCEAEFGCFGPKKRITLSGAHHSRYEISDHHCVFLNTAPFPHRTQMEMLCDEKEVFASTDEWFYLVRRSPSTLRQG